MRYGRTIIRAYHGVYGKKTLKKLENALREEIEFYDVIARGKLYKSIRVGYGSVIIEVPYAYFVNVGTKPHVAPLKPLIEWAMAKFKVDRRIAYAIAKTVQEKIRMYGTKPRHFIDDALEDVGVRKA